MAYGGGDPTRLWSLGGQVAPVTRAQAEEYAAQGLGSAIDQSLYDPWGRVAHYALTPDWVNLVQNWQDRWAPFQGQGTVDWTDPNWMFGEWSRNIPQVGPPPLPGAPPTPLDKRAKDVSLQDYVHQATVNALLPYMDPITKYETMQWLARDAPDVYGEYGRAPLPTELGRPGYLTYENLFGPYIRPEGELGTPFGTYEMPTAQPTLPVGGGAAGPSYQALTQAQLADFLSPEAIASMITDLDYDKILARLPALVRTDILGQTTSGLEAAPGQTLTPAQIKERKERNIIAGKDIQSALNWAREALRFGAQALPGTTRAQQKLSQEHFATLMREAEQEPLKAGRYVTSIQNILNPILARARPTGILGRTRSLAQPAGEFARKGLVYRNPFLT